MTASRETQQAWAIWQAGRRPDPQHPYLTHHRIRPMQLRQSRQGALILPLCVRGTFQGVRLIPWNMSKPSATIGGTPLGCSVPTGRYQPGQPLAVTVDWPSAVALHQMGMTAWACLSLDNLGTVALQARSLVGSTPMPLAIAMNSTMSTRRSRLSIFDMNERGFPTRSERSRWDRPTALRARTSASTAAS